MDSLKRNSSDLIDMIDTDAADELYMLNHLSCIVDEFVEQRRYEDAAFLRWAIRKIKKNISEYEL